MARNERERGREVFISGIVTEGEGLRMRGKEEEKYLSVV